MTAPPYALVTKTYRGDLASFAELCGSIDRFAPGVRHIVVVDHADMELFARFSGPFRQVIDASAYLPELREFTVLGQRLWLHGWRRPVRGWIYQQLAKIAVVAALDERAVVLIDSDSRMIAPLSADEIFSGVMVRFFRDPGAPSGPVAKSPKWHDAAAYALGLPLNGYTGADYIAGAVVWSPDVVRMMVRQIERHHGGEWIEPLLRRLRFSEYVLYGIFCEHVQGPHRKLVCPTERELSHCSWKYKFTRSEEVDRFLADLTTDASVVLVQSNLQMTKGEIDRIFERVAIRQAELLSDQAVAQQPGMLTAE